MPILLTHKGTRDSGRLHSFCGEGSCWHIIQFVTQYYRRLWSISLPASVVLCLGGAQFIYLFKICWLGITTWILAFLLLAFAIFCLVQDRVRTIKEGKVKDDDAEVVRRTNAINLRVAQNEALSRGVDISDLEGHNS